MTAMTTGYPTLSAVLWPDRAASRFLRAAVLMVAGSLLLTLSAKIQVQFWPVPMTMQGFVVLVIGMAYGARLGAATLFFYLLQGSLGLPVFAWGGGFGYLAGPTGGYLIGFMVAAGLVGWLAERGWDRVPLKTLAAMLLGMGVIYLLGVGWYGHLAGLETAIAKGAVPFLAADAFKVVLAAAVLPTAWKLVGKRA